ncbi:MAG: dihydroxy-acid dehydratase, partial [Litoreibacter sp.]|nr:dihydroxy-acid dehydratase [Litoreibacter sp.]
HENTVVINSAIGGSTNAPIHLNGIAKHLGLELTNDDWQSLGHRVPLLVNLQPAGKYLGEDYHRAGGVPAVVGELLRAGLLPHPDAITANGKTMRENCESVVSSNADVIHGIDTPMVKDAGFINLKGNLFDSAIMKTSVISQEFRDRYLSNADDPEAFEGRAIVFDGPEDFHRRIDDESLAIDEHCILIMRGAGPKGYPGGAEVVNMRPPSYLLKKGIHALPCVGDGRQSGTSGSPSILNASPEAADGGGLALVQTDDRVRIDLKKCTADMLVDDATLKARAEKLVNGSIEVPDSQTPWQEIFRQLVRPFSEGMTLHGAAKYQDISRRFMPRDNH